MAFRLTDRHIQQYHELGFTVFDSLVPPSLLRELRVMAERGREIHWSNIGRQSQRLTPLQKYNVDMTPFHRYAQLPELQAALDQLLGPGATFSYTNLPELTSDVSILFEPREGAWCTHWHRDQRDNIPGMDVHAWGARLLDWRLFNQVNAPLYHDVSTWVVPGSHLRRDLPAEVALFPDRPIMAPDWELYPTAEAKERACLDYCRSMPGAMEVHLHAGDFLLYRNSLWHLGSYASYRRRATLHAPLWTPEYLDWSNGLPMRADGKREFLNPNVNR
jgi:hypothetical protein